MNRREFLLKSFKLGGAMACASLGFSTKEIAWASLNPYIAGSTGDAPAGNPNLVTDGDFSAGDGAAWDDSSPAQGTFDYSGGNCEMTNNPAYGYFGQTISLTNGVQYDYSFDVVAFTTPGLLNFESPNGTVIVSGIDTVQTYSGTFTAGATGTFRFIFASSNTARVVTIDNVSISLH